MLRGSFIVALVAVLFVFLDQYATYKKQNPNYSEDFSSPPPPFLMSIISIIQNFYRQTIPELMEPPFARVMNDIQAYKLSQSIMTVAKLNIPDYIGENGSKSCIELAKQLNVHIDSLCRLMQFLAIHGYFYEISQGTFKNTRLSLILSDNHINHLKYMAQMNMREFHAMNSLQDVVKTGNPVSSDSFQLFEEDNTQLLVFAKAMEETLTLQNGIEKLIKLKNDSIIADIGGGTGSFLNKLLMVNPNVTGVLYELPGVIKEAKKLWQNDQYYKYIDRISFIDGSFFDFIPSKDPKTNRSIDYYTLKTIIHDWGDTEAIKILKNLRAAMNSKSEVYFIEAGKGIDDNFEETRRTLDITMMLYGGRERTKEDWKILLEQTGFKLFDISYAGLFSVIKAVPI